MSFDWGGTEDVGQSKSRLKQEVDSWRHYVEALRQEDREVFREMINSVSATYSEAIERAERGYDTESLLMSIILKQQKTISWLSNLAARCREEKIHDKTKELTNQ